MLDNIREKIVSFKEDKPGIFFGIIGLVVLLAFGRLVMLFFPGGPDIKTATVQFAQDYYYDPDTEVISIADVALKELPIEKDGKTLYRAVMYSCSDCSEGNRKLGWIERFASQGEIEEYITLLQQDAATDEDAERIRNEVENVITPPIMFQLPGEDAWYHRRSDQGKEKIRNRKDALVDEFPNCSRRKLKRCTPPTREGQVKTTAK